MQTSNPPKTDIFLKYVLLTYRKKVEPKQAKDCNPEKHLHSYVEIVLTTLLVTPEPLATWDYLN